MKSIVTLAIALFCCVHLYAQAPAPVEPPYTYNTIPGIYNVANGKLYYTAQDTAGREIWEYAETATPPKVSYNLPGGGMISGIDRLGSLNGKIYFSRSSQLYAYDGVNPPAPATNVPASVSGPNNMTTIGSKLYFAANNPLNGGRRDLYAYDGINSPTVITTATSATSSANPTNITEVNGKLYFSALGTSTFQTLHVYTPGNTSAIEVPSAGANPNFFTGTGNKVYYLASGTTTGSEVWKYDGTTATRLTDLAPGNLNGAVNGLAYLKGYVYFGGSTNGSSTQLYKLDTATNTASLALTVNPAGDGRVSGHFIYKAKVYFIGSNAATGREFWSYDGTTGGITADIYPGPGSGVDITIPSWGIFNNHLYYGGDDGINGVQLWRINDPTSVTSIKFDGEVNVFPNPASSSATLSLTLHSAQSLCVVLTDVSGRKVFTTDVKHFASGKNNITLPMAALAAGQYFYHINSREGAALASGVVVKQ